MLKLEILNLNLVKLMLIISVTVFGSLAVAAQTVPNNNLVTFAQFVEREGTQDFLFSSISRRDAFYETVAGGSPIYFRYQNIQI